MSSSLFKINTSLLANLLLALFFILLIAAASFGKINSANNLLDMNSVTSVAAATNPPGFGQNAVVEEKGSMMESNNPYWWLNSGGKMIIQDGVAYTIEGTLFPYAKWRLSYAEDNPVDTGNGYYPQNLFRLVSRSEWQDFSQQLYFYIDKDNLTDTPNRNESNGILLFDRYADANNLYYAGIRVDGTVVIKKKINGQYYTMAQASVIPGTYDRNINPSLMPKKVWIGLRSDVVTDNNGQVVIALYLDPSGNGQWQKVLTAVDDGVQYGQPVFKAGYTGIRADFMDVRFKDYRVAEI